MGNPWDPEGPEKFIENLNKIHDPAVILSNSGCDREVYLLSDEHYDIITLNEEFSNLSIWINNIDQNIILASKINQEQVNEAVSNAINVRISYYIIAITISSIFGALFGSLLTYVKIKKS